MAEQKIIGRKKELKALKTIYNSGESEFLAVYGRRRVGKTYLIREFFKNKGTYFELTGQKEGTLAEQLENFATVFSETFFEGMSVKRPKSWKKAFALLTKQLDKLPKGKKCILFFDELPWLARARSGFVQALDYYWNRYWSSRRNLILIVCGSAASWMLDHLINAKGGLYNRLTRVILLRPYTLGETLDYLNAKGVRCTDKQLCNLYMVFGGIPYYLKQVSKGMSVAQAINRVCFQKEGLLYSEFDRLFKSLFDGAEVHHKIVKAVSKSRKGISRDALIKEVGATTGGTFKKRLFELEAAGFIQSYIPYGNKRKEQFYRIIDEYVFFYLHWISPLKKRGVEGGKSYWQAKAKTPKAVAWMGYAFETLCLKHVDQIKEALELDAIACETGSWRYLPKEGSRDQGAQVDLLFDRDDGIITLCEIKFSEKVFTVDKACAKELAKKLTVFEKYFKTNKQVQLAMITFAGMKDSIWSEDLIDQDMIFEELF
ncbi:AAA family ATPase [Candidatus Neptunochlamydia vexilliferae]|nr:ATP-binding protein [Candidatus Neptunochlamydia vexilliferae]